MTERDLQELDMRRRYAQYMSENGVEPDDDVENLDYRYNRLVMEAELRLIERGGEPKIERIEPEYLERENAMRVSD